MSRMRCAAGEEVGLTICPTMGCNFDCPYCFENHKSGKMTEKTQDEVIGLARRMLEHSHARRLQVSWFGGEPLLAPGVIEALSERLIALCEERGAQYGAGIITNGYLLTQDLAERPEKPVTRLADPERKIKQSEIKRTVIRQIRTAVRFFYFLFRGNEKYGILYEERAGR